MILFRMTANGWIGTIGYTIIVNQYNTGPRLVVNSQFRKQ